MTSLTIVEPGPTATIITADTDECTTGTAGGDACDPAADTVCKLGEADWCRCGLDPADDMMMKGLWNCDPFAPMSVVVATFDRLLGTDTLDPGDGGETSRDDIADLTATPAPAVAVSSATDYSSTGAPSGAVFNVYGPFFGNNRSGGPSLQVAGAPALPTSSTIDVKLLPTRVTAKDGKTSFTGTGLLADGAITFKTGAFDATLTVPTAPPPPEMDAGATEPDAGTAADGGASDAAASDAGADGGADAGVAADGGVVDASVSEVAAVADAAASDVGAATDAAKVDAVASEAGASDAPVVVTPTPTPGEPVPADLNKAPVTIAFNNVVDPAQVAMHVTITENGLPFTDWEIDASMAPTLAIVPKKDPTMDATKDKVWAAGKTYVIIVDANVADVVGDKLGKPLAGAFVMAN